jgi:hypothetical protein
LISRRYSTWAQQLCSLSCVALSTNRRRQAFSLNRASLLQAYGCLGHVVVGAVALFAALAVFLSSPGVILTISGVVSSSFASGTSFIRELGAGGDVVVVGAAVVTVRDACQSSWAFSRPFVVGGVTSLAALERSIRDPRFYQVWLVCIWVPECL